MDRRRAVVGALAAALGVAGLGLTGPAAAGPSVPRAAPTAACQAGSDGVTVVVDFADLPGGVQIRCVTGEVSSGFDALKKAGFTYTGTQRFPGLLCRIDGKPADDPCVNAPPPDRYWAYWTAEAPGGEWTYSDLGAGNRTPPPGSVEGWAFSDGCTRAPQGPPCPGPTTTTTRPRTTTTTPGSGGTTGGPAGTTSPSTPGAVGDPRAGSTTVEEGEPGPTVTTVVPAGGTAPGPGEEGDDPSDGDEDALAPAGDSGGDDGSPAGALLGLAVAGGLGAATVIAARRRRRAEGEPA